MHVTTHLINNRAYTSQFPLQEEYHFEPGKNYLFHLSYLSSIPVIGEQAAAFLQGQLSCDIRAVTATTFQQGALCSLQGRILALLRVIHWKNFELVLPQDLIEPTIKSLSKPAALARVRLEENPLPLLIYGLLVDNQTDCLPKGITRPQEPFSVLHTEETFCAYLGHDQEGRALYLLLASQPATASSWVDAFSTINQLRGSLAWHHHLLTQKQVEIYSNTRGLFLPHRLDLDRLNYINLNKGCYKGQEVIARMHYKAKRKHNVHCWSISSKEPLTAGKNVLDPEGTSVGELIDYSPLETNRFRVVVSMKREYPAELRFEDHTQLVELSRQ